MKINFFGVLGIVFVVFMATLAWKNVGTLYCEKPYILEGSIIYAIVVVTGLPFVLGFLAGRDGG
jgi:hypothetical protein